MAACLFAAENENSPKIKYHFRPEIENLRSFSAKKQNENETSTYKVITTMVIRPLDDPT